MKNICYLLLLLALSVTAVTGQTQACINAQSALVRSERCTVANTEVNLFLQGFDVVVEREVLNTYCSDTCRNIFLRIRVDCDNDVSSNSTHIIATELVLVYC